jgi:hypothetical protein
LSSHDSVSSELKNSSPSFWISRDSNSCILTQSSQISFSGQAPLAQGMHVHGRTTCCSKFDPNVKTLERFERFLCRRFSSVDDQTIGRGSTLAANVVHFAPLAIVF